MTLGPHRSACGSSSGDGPGLPSSEIGEEDHRPVTWRGWRPLRRAILMACLAPTLIAAATSTGPARADAPVTPDGAIPAAPRLPRDDLMVFCGPDGRPSTVRTTEDWARRLVEILAGMQAVMGRLPGDQKRCPLDMRVEEETDCGTYLRRLVTYSSEPGSRVPAYLLVPKSALRGEGGRFPAVLCLHGTDDVGLGTVVGLGSKPNRHDP
jgi:hypothetical protein